MGEEKTQAVLLREVAQQFCKEGVFPVVPKRVQQRPQPVVLALRKLVKRQPSFIKVFIRDQGIHICF
jgi:hypothetical protein